MQRCSQHLFWRKQGGWPHNAGHCDKWHDSFYTPTLQGVPALFGNVFSSAVKIICRIWNWLPCDTETMAHCNPCVKWVAKTKNSLTFRGQQCRTNNFVANRSEQLYSYGFFVCAKETSMWEAGITDEYTDLWRYSYMFRQQNAEHHLDRGLSFSQQWIRTKGRPENRWRDEVRNKLFQEARTEKLDPAR
jgi:hypothetical protein